jgi:TRAP-type C4-dicarboxylate transport system permease small subunit
MSDRAFCFLFSCVVILASLCAAGWLAATGQATTVDGLFLLLTCLIVALAFALYVMFMIRRAMEPLEKPAAKPAATAKAAAAQPKAAPLVPAEKAE